ncbi:Acyl-CoA N-acyltransferase [Sesbania bispinosa]|nr:Acyl-CoA N-acyltransferase [Sesbania bispinosa]
MTFPCASSTLKLNQNLNLHSNPAMQTRIPVPLSANIPISHCFSPLTSISSHINLNSLQKTRFQCMIAKASNEADMPTMSEILEASRAQKLDLQLQTLGPFFRITAKSLVTETELGKAEGFIRIWVEGKILHLDSIRLRRETLNMEKSIFGLGLYIGAVAIRHGYDCGCKTAQLLAINDSDLYHSKLVRFYTRLGFKPVYEVTGSAIGDLAHMLVWGGVGTRMDASVEELMIKWCKRFKSQNTP